MHSFRLKLIFLNDTSAPCKKKRVYSLTQTAPHRVHTFWSSFFLCFKICTVRSSFCTARHACVLGTHRMTKLILYLLHVWRLHIPRCCPYFGKISRLVSQSIVELGFLDEDACCSLERKLGAALSF